MKLSPIIGHRLPINKNSTIKLSIESFKSMLSDTNMA